MPSDEMKQAWIGKLNGIQGIESIFANRFNCRRALLIALAAFCLLASSACPVWAASTCSADTGRGRSFAGQDLTNHNFSADPPGSLVGADFSNAKLSGAIFSGQDLTLARFQNANLGPKKAPVNFTNSKLDRTCFAGANLDATDFSFASIRCADFSGTSLITASFGPAQNIIADKVCRTRFNGATLDVHLITNDYSGKSNWSKSDFTAANFQDLSPSTFSLAGKDITGAILAQTNFTGIDMTGANLTDVDFSSATLTKAILKNAAIDGAKFNNAQAPSAVFVCAQAYGNSGGQKLPDGTACPNVPTSTDPTRAADFTTTALKNADFTAATMDHAILVSSNLTGAIFSNSSLVQAILQSQSGTTGPATVQFATFTNANFSNAQLAGVDFSGGTLAGAHFDNTALSGTSFSNATMPNASFQSSTLQSVNFSFANLQGAKFGNAKIQAPPNGSGSGANYSCSQLGGADFTNANIAASSFSNAVMPAAPDCCPVDGQHASPWCGIIDATQQTYGPVTFPVLSVPVTCPNGDTAKCNGSQWQLSPNWETETCSYPPVPQQMWSRPNCGGKPTDIVVFKDDNLKACILASLPGKPTEVLLSTAQQMTQVNCPGRGIKDLSGLENFISLIKLDLSNNSLPIFTLTFTAGGKPAPSNLQTLNLDHNQLTTLDLTSHPKMAFLSAAYNQLSSISLSANTYLVVLDASHNQLQSFDLPVQSLLAYADFSYNLLSNVLNSFSQNLNALSALNYLDLSHNVLSTIGSIGSITYNKLTNQGALQSLFLGCNPKFQCGTLGVYNGTTYPAASTSQCSAYNTSTSEWTALTTPRCTP